MKKLILLGVVAVVAVLLAVYGRDGLDLYRLISHVEASSAASEADGGPWPRLTDACIGCHGVQGHSQHQGYPTLAGQPAPYLAAQLKRFASGERANPNMGPLAISLSEAEIEQLSEYFAKQSPVANRSFKPDPALREQGEKLAANGGCAACHGEGLLGHEQFPRLAGQGHDYLLAQLDAFAQGRRQDPTGAMTAISATLSAEDRQALAHYLAALAPVAQ
ncbi:c-type cytochrome [Pseudomonas aeruginosa]|uniref:c-type cytochrome n=1 Tax=Pseudomonas aeruginosa TaxID=287 RepID=UPI000F62BB1F|nr:c-type cytochrome [Pseudomonas aeruginosa]VDK92270.1 Cytochrome c-552 [Pseudomonas aeruginosa]VDL10069.1 Cytochrome c-552 [Pseudomonas aeruginosa]VDL13616.1 Cytochrome c-552 [Pseudomonas aeruginosa]VDL48829.1 Cytochrome c-552 [Pseudomonas aeruginosa]VDL52012.1 Cytochrome c-552 [Pseudomonas aeruginosa]